MKRLLFVISALCAANLFGDTGAVRAALAKKTLPGTAKMSSSNAIFAEFEAADKACDEAWRECKTKDEFFARSKRVREDFIKAVGGFPEERCPLNAKTVATVKRDGYIVEKVYFESWPNVHVTANLFIPDDPKYKAPYPAVLLPCGHSNNGKGADAYQRGCVLAAKAGLACLIYDPYDQGERGQGKHRANVNAHNRAGALAALLGGSMARYRMWDGMRAIDYLESRPEVDASRIGVMGNSGGGTMTSLLMAVDPRLKAACPSCFISTLTANAKNIAPGDAEQNTFAQLAIGANHASFALMQPERPVRFQFCHGDFFPFYGSLSTFKLVKKVASKFGLGERYEMTDVDGPHGWKESTRTSSVEWMRRWLCGDKDAFKHDLDGYRKLDKTFNPRKSDMGVCNGGEIVCPKGKVLNLPGERTIYDLIRDEYAATESARKERVSPETVARLAGISTDNIGTRGVWREVSCVEADGFKDVRLTLTFKNGLAVPIVYFRPRNLAKGMTPLLIVGNGQKTQHEKAVAAALRDGRAVVIADLVGCGEINGFKHRFYRAPENEECIAVLLYSLGRSIVGMQAEEILEIANEMKKWFGVAPELEAHDRTCIAAAHAAFVAPGLVSSVKTVSPPPSWGESVEKGGMVPFANVVNGALRHYDWTSLLAWRRSMASLVNY